MDMPRYFVNSSFKIHPNFNKNNGFYGRSILSPAWAEGYGVNDSLAETRACVTRA